MGLRTGVETTWVRLYDEAGRLVPTPEEAADARAEAAHRRADAAEAELARLRARLEDANG